MQLRSGRWVTDAAAPLAGLAGSTDTGNSSMCDSKAGLQQLLGSIKNLAAAKVAAASLAGLAAQARVAFLLLQLDCSSS